MPDAGPRRAAPAVALLASVLLSGGCDIPGLGALGAGDAAGATPSPGSTDSWIIVAEGAASTSPAVGARRSPSPSPDALRPPAVAAPARTTAPRCTGTSRPGQINGLDVRAGAGSATVSWFNTGDPGLLSYRVAAVPQRLQEGQQAPVDWRSIPAGAGCRTMTSTISGLTRGASYVFWLDAVSTRLIGDGTRDSAIARSGVVVVG